MKRPAGKPPRKHYLKEWREHLDITQERAMDRLGWSQSKISRVENLRIPLTLDDLYEAAEAYGRSTYELMNVNPLKEREVVDITDLLLQGNPDQRKQVSDYAEYIIKKSG
jgi:transcriptional regulator with XRE-family HTH domain